MQPARTDPRRMAMGKNVIWMEHARLVHVRRSDSTRLVSLIHERHHLIVAVDDEFREVLDVRPETGVLTDPEVAGVLGVQKVPHLLVIDFDVGDFHSETNVGVRLLLLDPREQLGTCKWYNTLVGAICERGLLRGEHGEPSEDTHNPSYCTGMTSITRYMLKESEVRTCKTFQNLLACRVSLHSTSSLACIPHAPVCPSIPMFSI